MRTTLVRGSKKEFTVLFKGWGVPSCKKRKRAVPTQSKETKEAVLGEGQNDKGKSPVRRDWGKKRLRVGGKKRKRGEMSKGRKGESNTCNRNLKIAARKREPSKRKESPDRRCERKEAFLEKGNTRGILMGNA